MIGRSLDIIGTQDFGKVFHLLAGEAIDDTRFALVLPDEFDNLLMQLDGLAGFGPYLVVEVGAVERGDKKAGVLHAEVLDNVLLHLGGGRGGEGEDGSLLVDMVDGIAQASVLGAEIVSPL